VDREAVLGSAGGLLTLPFGIAQGTKLRPVIHSGGFIGIEVPVWDIADNFGDTNLLVTNMAQANDLAKCLGENRHRNDIYKNGNDPRRLCDDSDDVVDRHSRTLGHRE
jgi:hypothetical protein